MVQIRLRKAYPRKAEPLRMCARILAAENWTWNIPSRKHNDDDDDDDKFWSLWIGSAFGGESWEWQLIAGAGIGMMFLTGPWQTGRPLGSSHNLSDGEEVV